FVNWSYTDLQTLQQQNEPTWANIQYDFWDMWQGNKPLPYLPGQFFYKGSGMIVAVGRETADDRPILPTEIDQYMLGGYGGIRTKGRDVLGDERPISYLMRAGLAPGWLADATIGLPAAAAALPLQGGPPDPEGPGEIGDPLSTLEIWPWTRSVTADNEYAGSPYAPSFPGDSNEQLQKGNPNGIRDGLILVLSAGDDNPEDRS
ncbi:hypothetical protein IT575_00105, partial [bacterium]|nr:hypothetical protein [bacterium]